MARNNRVNSRIEFAPLIPDRMEVRVADAAKKDVNLHIVMGWIAPRNCRAGKRRCCAGSGVSFGLIHGWILLGIVCRRLVPSSPPTFRQAAPLWRYESWQWFSPGENQITSPGRISSTGPPQRCAQPQPAVTTRVCPSGWVCQAVRAAGSKVTLAPKTRAGEGALKSGSTRTAPVKYSAGPLPEGCEPLRLISIWRLLAYPLV